MNRRFFNSIFAILIFVAHLNCVLEHGLAANIDVSRSVHATSGKSTIPASDPQGCERPGCICKGATVAENFVFAETSCCVFIAGFAGFSIQTIEWIPSDHEIMDGRQRSHVGKPTRALDYCAWLQTFSI